MLPASLRRIGITVAAVVLLSGAAGIATAQSFQGAGETVVVGPDETYDSVQGVAGTVIVRGTVRNDVSAAAGSVHVTESGAVGGDVEAAAGTVRIDGTVDGDVDAAGGSVIVGPTGGIAGDLDVGASYFELNGTVDGDVQAGAETVVLGPSATVGGSVRYDAESFVRAPGATVEGAVVQDTRLGETAAPDLSVPGWLGALYGLLANLLLGVLLLALFPGFSARVADGVTDRPARSTGVGLLTVFAVPLVLLLVALTIVGIPLSLVGAIAFAVLVWVAVVYGQYALGVWALSFTDRENRWLALVVGLVGVTVLGAVPVLGALLDLAVFLLGLGALVLALRGAYERRGEEPVGGRQTTLDEATGDTSAA